MYTVNTDNEDRGNASTDNETAIKKEKLLEMLPLLERERSRRLQVHGRKFS